MVSKLKFLAVGIAFSFCANASTLNVPSTPKHPHQNYFKKLKDSLPENIGGYYLRNGEKKLFSYQSQGYTVTITDKRMIAISQSVDKRERQNNFDSPVVVWDKPQNWDDNPIVILFHENGDIGVVSGLTSFAYEIKVPEGYKAIHPLGCGDFVAGIFDYGNGQLLKWFSFNPERKTLLVSTEVLVPGRFEGVSCSFDGLELETSVIRKSISFPSF